MGWSATPLLASGGLITESVYDQVKAAIDERYDAIGASFGKPAAVSADALNKWATIISYRSKIESLLGSFYQKSGLGESTTFAAWTRDAIMTACFGAGTTDWPNKDNKLLRASHFANMQTVLNTLCIYRPQNKANMYASYYNFPAATYSDSADNVCDLFDAASSQVYSNNGGLGSVGIFAQNHYLFGYKLRHFINAYFGHAIDWGYQEYKAYVDCRQINAYDVPSNGINNCWVPVVFVHHWKSYNNGAGVAPSNDTDFTIHTGTSTPTNSFNGIHDYGSLAGSVTISGVKDGGPSDNTMCELAGSDFTAGVRNYLRAAFRDAINRDLGPTWDYSSRFFVFRAGVGRVYFDANFSYCA